MREGWNHNLCLHEKRNLIGNFSVLIVISNVMRILKFFLAIVSKPSYELATVYTIRTVILPARPAPTSLVINREKI
jgi:hypothetical protein